MPMKSTKRPREILPEKVPIILSSESGAAVFVQIREQIRNLIAQGHLAPGMRLPAIRALAKKLNVNQITVARAYRHLGEAGITEGRHGGGTYVASPTSLIETKSAAQPHKQSDPLLAERLFELAHAPGVISFSANYPKLDEKRISDYRSCLVHAVDRKLDTCLLYEPPTGRPSLQHQIAIHLAARGIDVEPHSIIITSGAQQAIDLTARALVSHNSPVIMERPAYYGAINAFRNAGARILEVPLQEDGMDIDALETLLSRHKARLIYTNPTFQNPTGITMSEAKRRALLSLARRFKATILEDDHSSDLRFRGPAVASIRAMAETDDSVCYVHGFGKALLPGSRLGFLVAPNSVRQAVLQIKAHADLHCNALMQEALAIYLEKQEMKRSLVWMKKLYGERQQRLYQSLRAGMPEGTQINQPEGGLSLWLTLPGDAFVSELYFRAVRRGVAFVPGEVFFASVPNHRSLRISFGLNSDSELEEGVGRLCSVVNDITNRVNRDMVLIQ
jgi:2-aminoadipate transaminase